MIDYHSLVIKERMARYLKSAEFDPYFERLHLPAAALWAAAIIAPLTIVKASLGQAAWKKIRVGDARTKSLRERYRRLGDTGEVIFTYVIVANSNLMYQEGAAAPALVAGNFNQGRDNLKILDLLPRFGEAALGVPETPEDAELSKLLEDLDYTFKRRRSMPARFSGGLDVTAFDLQIIGEYLPTRKLQVETIPCIAEPGPRGLICMIPFKLIEDVFSDIERSIATN